MLKAHPHLSRSGRLLAWFSLVNGLITLATPFLLSVLFKQPVPLFVFFSCAVLSLVSLTAGYYGLQANAWAFWLLFVLFLIQGAEYFSPSFFISFIGPVSLKFGWGSMVPPSRTNINLLALVVCYFAYQNARHLGQISQDTV